MAQGLTLQQLQSMGAKPAIDTSGSGLTLDQILAKQKEQQTSPTQGNPDVGVNGDLFTRKDKTVTPLDTASHSDPNQSGQLLNAVTQSEQNFGKDIAQAGYLLFGGQKKIDQITQSYLDNGTRLTDLAKKQTDPALKQKYAQMAISMYQDAQKVGGSVIGNARTPEQIVGDALGTAADIAAVGDYSGIAKGVGAIEKPATSILKATGKGAIKGAIQGGVYGATKGGAGGLSENLSAGGVAGKAVVGGVEGAAAGAVIGGAIEGGGAAMKGKPLLNPLTKEQELTKIQNTISPKPTVKEARLAESQGRLVKGREPSLLRGGKEDVVLPSQKTIRASQTIQENIPGAAKMDEAKLYIALDKKTGEIAQNLKPEMQKVPVTPKTADNVSSVWNDLKKAQIEDVPATEEANVTKLQNKFQSILDRLGKTDNPTMDDYWSAAKDYDQSVKETVKKANNLSPESLQMQKEIWLQNRVILRGAINDTSTGLGETSQKAFSDMTDMYHSKEGILSKAKINTKVQPSKLIQLAKKHPVITGALEGIAGYKLARSIGLPLP